MSGVDFQWFLNPTQMGDPCNEQRIAEIGQNVGRQLPFDYCAFVMETGGGSLFSCWGNVCVGCILCVPLKDSRSEVCNVFR